MMNQLKGLAPLTLILAALLACKGGGGTSGGAPAPEGPAIVVTAKDLAKEYHANEVAADEKYKGKHLRVGGTVQSIDKDAFDNMIVHLATDNEFMGVMSTMKDEAKASVAKLSKGQPVVLDCRGEGMIIGSPTLKDCTVLLTNETAPASAPPTKKK